jgi:pimeloyl-ACP methyl ester carboxylesterase
MSSRQWKHLGGMLSASYRVVTPDFLGSGESPPWPDAEPFDFSLDVDAAFEVIASLGEPVHLVGHSYGGLVALMLARRAPQSIRSLTVYDPVAFGVLYGADDAEGLADLARASENPVFTDSATGGGDAWLEAFVDYWNGSGTWRAMPAPARDAFLRVGRKVFYEVTSLMQDRTPASAYGDIDAPVLLLSGEKSPAAARRVMAVLAAALRHARTLTIESAGHMGPITHAAVVDGVIAEHIASSSS